MLPSGQLESCSDVFEEVVRLAAFGDVFWLLLMFFAVMPMFKQWNLERERMALIRRIEKKRGSRVISLIHRQEQTGFMAFFSRRFIDIEDSEEVLRAIKLTPPDVPIDLIVHTPGGLLLAAEQIAMALKKHRGKVTVFVPHYAMSGGTLIALAADEIVMDENAVLGPVDPQLGNMPAASILKVVRSKPISEIDDQTLIMADVAEKAISQTERFVFELLSDKMSEDRAKELARALTEGRWTHDYPITCDEASRLGLPISCDMPEEVYELMDLYPQAANRRPSVHYIPYPYRVPAGGEGRGEVRDRFVW